jgi:ADP-heptose:LPS heptosyltransferase
MVAEFIRYGHARPEFAGAVVIHIRERKDLAPERNWPTDSWALLVSSIARLGFASRIIAVGTRSASGIIPGVEDYRGAPLQDQMDILASAKFAVGTSSGPMHLASFCGCPHVVWLGGPKDERRFTGDRYMELWNPFKTPVIVLDQWDWQAPVEAVLDAVARIGERK